VTNTSRIDVAILSTVGERWLKAAMVIVKVTKLMQSDSPPTEEDCETISDRIQFLVHDSRLAARGDTKNWRFSEVHISQN
jgi:hypothetical protein